MLTPYFERRHWCRICHRETIQWRDRAGLPQRWWRLPPLALIRCTMIELLCPWRCRDCGKARGMRG